MSFSTFQFILYLLHGKADDLNESERRKFSL